ncbi:MAG: DNA replication/repair protein RecF [Spirochaetes bacterium]|nr:DNA replication/repair protein RecF [Spirochaetota bacterium]
MNSISDIFGIFQVIEFVQSDSEIIYGSPVERRRFFDIAASHSSGSYYNSLRKFLRALKQRNLQIKKDISCNKNERHLWDLSLAQNAATLIKHRKKLAEDLSLRCNKKLESFTNESSRLTIEYCPSFDIDWNNVEKSFLETLQKSYKVENIYKSTVRGPHRDNFIFYKNGKNMRKYASQGEVRLAVLSLKLALVEHLSEIYNMHPILIFDDILLELDDLNAQRLLSSLDSSNQFFFTSTRVPDLDFFKGMDKNFFFNIKKY